MELIFPTAYFSRVSSPLSAQAINQSRSNKLALLISPCWSLVSAKTTTTHPPTTIQSDTLSKHCKCHIWSQTSLEHQAVQSSHFSKSVSSSSQFSQSVQSVSSVNSVQSEGAVHKFSQLSQSVQSVNSIISSVIQFRHPVQCIRSITSVTQFGPINNLSLVNFLR